MNGAVALAQSTDRLLKGVPADSEDVGRQWIADIKEGLRLLQGVVRSCLRHAHTPCWSTFAVTKLFCCPVRPT